MQLDRRHLFSIYIYIEPTENSNPSPRKFFPHIHNLGHSPSIIVHFLLFNEAIGWLKIFFETDLHLKF